MHYISNGDLMGYSKINFNNFFFSAICVCLVVFSINYEFFGFLRILDLIILTLFGLFFFLKPKINNKQLVTFLLIAFVLVLSTYLGVLKNGPIKISRLIFIYKYLFIFLLPWLIVSVIKTEKQIIIVNKLLLINFILLSIWSWMYVYLRFIGLIDGQPRPSFPTLEFHQSDAHLYSSYLGFFLSAYILYIKDFFRHNLFLSFIISFNGIVGLLMTGSRTGILLISITFLAFSFSEFKNYLNLVNKFKKIQIKKLFYALSILIFLIELLFMFQYEFINNLNYLIQRTLNFNLLNDLSSLSRLTKLTLSFEEVSHLGWLLGNGLKSKLTWYDGIFSMLMAHGGLLIIILFIIFYFLIMKKIFVNVLNKKNHKIFVFLIGIYLISNLITEHIMISRNAFPVLVFLATMYVTIKKKTISNN